MLKCMFGVCGLILGLIAVPKAEAQVTIDISRITCDQFLGYRSINPDDLAMWLSGYYSAKRGYTIVDIELLAAQKRRLQDYCLRNVNVPVMKAIDELFHPLAPTR